MRDQYAGYAAVLAAGLGLASREVAYPTETSYVLSRA